VAAEIVEAELLAALVFLVQLDARHELEPGDDQILGAVPILEPLERGGIEIRLRGPPERVPKRPFALRADLRHAEVAASLALLPLFQRAIRGR
jgi:hypothetical protein